ncbi:MAG TPA: BON domain-containing protein [Kofleriaceae bacterium]
MGGSPRHNTGEHGDRYQGGSQWGQGGRDQWAERDRDVYGDHEYDRGYHFDRDRDWVSNEQRGDQRGTGYGYDDGNGRQQMNYRGQSGSQAGGHYGSQSNTSSPNQQGCNRGHWGDFDRGGRSGGRDMNYDTMSPRYGREGEQSWGRDQGWNPQQGYGGQQMRGPHAGKGPQGFQRSDDRIKEMVHEALTDHEHLDATHITVDVKSGEVVLTGTVEDRHAKRLAEDIVERVTGVKDVLNQLRIQTQSRDSQAMSQSTSTNTSHLTSTTADKNKSKPS